jgi:protease-4
MLNKRDEVERRRGRIDDVLRGLSGSSTATSMILSALGMRPDDDASSSSSSRWPSKRCDRIAVVTVDGSIDRSCASRVIRSLREIKKDKQVKAVVLRVDSPGGSVVSSEAILEEIKLLDKVRTFPFASARTT